VRHSCEREQGQPVDVGQMRFLVTAKKIRLQENLGFVLTTTCSCVVVVREALWRLEYAAKFVNRLLAMLVRDAENAEEDHFFLIWRSRSGKEAQPCGRYRCRQRRDRWLLFAVTWPVECGAYSSGVSRRMKKGISLRTLWLE
jgi:hypothetical protein